MALITLDIIPRDHALHSVVAVHARCMCKVKDAVDLTISHEPIGGVPSADLVTFFGKRGWRLVTVMNAPRTKANQISRSIWAHFRKSFKHRVKPGDYPRCFWMVDNLVGLKTALRLAAEFGWRTARVPMWRAGARPIGQFCLVYGKNVNRTPAVLPMVDRWGAPYAGGEPFVEVSLLRHVCM